MDQKSFHTLANFVDKFMTQEDNWEGTSQECIQDNRKPSGTKPPFTKSTKSKETEDFIGKINIQRQFIKTKLLKRSPNKKTKVNSKRQKQRKK